MSKLGAGCVLRGPRHDDLTPQLIGTVTLQKKCYAVDNPTLYSSQLTPHHPPHHLPFPTTSKPRVIQLYS